MTTPETLKEWLSPLQDPELQMGLVELGLIYECSLNEEKVAYVKMTLTSPACPAAGFMVDQVQKKLMEHPEVEDAHVELVFEPKWDPKTMASDEVKDKLGIW